MNIYKFTIKSIKLPYDAKDIIISHMLNYHKTRTDTYINYYSESNPYKNCIYVLEGTWERIEESKNVILTKEEKHQIEELKKKNPLEEQILTFIEKT